MRAITNWSILLLFAFPIISLGNELSYRLHDIGTFGGNSSVALAINTHGDVVGWATNKKGERHAFLWTHHRMTDLGTLGGRSSRATDINDAGDIVGQSETRQHGVYHAFLWKKGRMIDLGTPSEKFSLGRAINLSDDIVCDMNDATGNFSVYLWHSQTKVILKQASIQEMNVYSINDHGQVVGVARFNTHAGGPHAFLWQKSKLTDLGTLGGNESEANSINNKGDIVGSADTSTGDTHVVLWHADKAIDLNWHGYPNYISQDKVIIGYKTAAGSQVGVLWEKGKLYDLNDLTINRNGWLIQNASKMNALGQIVGRGTRHHLTHALLLSPQ